MMVVKECRRCMRAKPYSEFHKSAANKDGLQGYCKECISEYLRNRTASSPRTDAQKEKNRVYARLYRYGVSKEKFDAMLDAQNNSCAVCKVEFTKELKPHVDHDHKCCPSTKTCGKCVRGLLCFQCNVFAGLIENRFSTHEAMFSYLHLHHKSLWGSI